jgi:repressor LexA
MENKETLTPTQKNVFNFLEDFLRRKGFPPTLREIASHFGLRGPKAPQKTLTILERKGYIRKIPGGSRAVEILGSKVARHSGLSYKRGFAESATAPTFLIPIIGRVQAGEPILAIENIEGYLNFDRSLVSSGDIFLLRVQGDSMIDAHIQDGDFALVKPQPNAE